MPSYEADVKRVAGLLKRSDEEAWEAARVTSGHVKGSKESGSATVSASQWARDVTAAGTKLSERHAQEIVQCWRTYGQKRHAGWSFWDHLQALHVGEDEDRVASHRIHAPAVAAAIRSNPSVRKAAIDALAADDQGSADFFEAVQERKLKERDIPSPQPRSGPSIEYLLTRILTDAAQLEAEATAKQLARRLRDEESPDLNRWIKDIRHASHYLAEVTESLSSFKLEVVG